MDTIELVAGAREWMGAKRVYGEPYERNGITVIPAATVAGGGGAGQGDSPDGKGSGGGFGLHARPAGAWVVEDGKVRWKPSIDVNRINLGWQIVMLAAVFVAGSVARARTRRPVRVAATARALKRVRSRKAHRFC